MTVRLSVFVFLALTVVTAWAGDSEVKYCTGGSPTDVLDFYCHAVNSRDIAALRGVHAEEFVHIPGGGNKARPWGRQFEIDSASKLFAEKAIESQELEFSGDYKVTPGETENTWVIGGLSVRMTTKFRDKSRDELSTADSGHQLTVKKFAEPVEHFALVKWEAPN